MKNVLIVSSCQKRGSSIGLIGKFLNAFTDFDKREYAFSLLDIGFFDVPHEPSQYPVDEYHGLPKRKIESLVRKIPIVRSWYAQHLVVSTFKVLMVQEKCDFVILYQIPVFADKLVKIAHDYNARIIFVPWGSDILRVTDHAKKQLINAFSAVDYVVGAEKSNTINAAKEIYNVPEEKLIKTKNYLSSIQLLMKLKGTKSRKEMMASVRVPYSDYNIVCGYNGSQFQRHKSIIEALAQNKENLPPNYQLILPMTYGLTLGYKEELIMMCNKHGLNVFFIEDFISNEQMAYLHLFTDLFIHVQPTDTGNAFMIEALFCENQIVTGSWLNYEQFEQFGAPYHIINSMDELPERLRQIFLGQIPPVQVPRRLIEMYTIPKDNVKGSIWKTLFEKV